MTDRESLLRRLDALVADIKSLEDTDAMREVIGYVDRVLVSVWPEPMPDDVADAIQAEVAPVVLEPASARKNDEEAEGHRGGFNWPGRSK